LNPQGSGDVTRTTFLFSFSALLFRFNTRKSGHQKETEMAELKAKVAQIESSKPALEALLKRVLELESKLEEGKK
jgi:hypothetical protein